MTDLKTWMSPLQPRRRRQGRLVKVGGPAHTNRRHEQAGSLHEVANPEPNVLEAPVRLPGVWLQVHAGFNGAWVHSGFNRKVLDRLKELDQGPTPLRFWIVGRACSHRAAVHRRMRTLPLVSCTALRTWCCGHAPVCLTAFRLCLPPQGTRWVAPWLPWLHWRSRGSIPTPS